MKQDFYMGRKFT